MSTTIQAAPSAARRLASFVVAGLTALVLSGCADPYGHRYANPSSSYVPGYTKKDGTYVSGYNRTTANSTKSDNYSYKGNYNPYTGKTGSRK